MSCTLMKLVAYMQRHRTKSSLQSCTKQDPRVMIMVQEPKTLLQKHTNIKKKLNPSPNQHTSLPLVKKLLNQTSHEKKWQEHKIIN